MPAKDGNGRILSLAELAVSSAGATGSGENYRDGAVFSTSRCGALTLCE